MLCIEVFRPDEMSLVINQHKNQKLISKLRRSRRGSRTNSMADLEQQVEAQWREPAGASPLPRDFALATTFPRRRVARPASDADATTLREAGLADSKQQMFQVES